MNLENIKWKNLVTEDHVLYDSIYVSILNRQVHSDRKLINGTRGLGSGLDAWKWEWGFPHAIVNAVSVWQVESVLKLDYGDGCTTLWLSKDHSTVQF